MDEDNLNIINIKIKNVDGNDFEIEFNLIDTEYTIENLKEYILINFFIDEKKNNKPTIKNVILYIKEFEIGDIFDNVHLLEIIKSFNTNKLIIKYFPDFDNYSLTEEDEYSLNNNESPKNIIKTIEKEIDEKINFYQGLIKANDEMDKLIKTKKNIYDKKLEEFLNKKDELNVYIDKIIECKILQKKSLDLIIDNQKLVGKMICQKVEIEHKEKEKVELEKKMKELKKTKEKENDLMNQYLKQ